jgi:hypothetical protein
VLRHAILGLPFLLPPRGFHSSSFFAIITALIYYLSIYIFNILSPSRFWKKSICRQKNEKDKRV